MLGRLLCWLGVHDNQLSNVNATVIPGGSVQIRSVWGFCTRCGSPWQLDN